MHPVVTAVERPRTREAARQQVDEIAWSVLLDEPPSIVESEPEDLNADGVIEYLLEVQRAQARLAALEARALVAAAGAHQRARELSVLDATGRERELAIADEVREEVSSALRRSPGVVHDQIVNARLLAGPLRRTRSALEAGRITEHHARAIADEVRRMSTSWAACHQDPRHDTPADAAQRSEFDAACDAVQKRCLPEAERLTPGQTRRLVRRVATAVDAEGAEARRQQAQARADVVMFAEDDGLAVLLARLPMEQAARVYAAINAQAHGLRASDQNGTSSTIGQLRVRALVDAVCSDSPSGSAQAGVEVQVVIDAATLLGLADNPATITTGPATNETLTAEALRELLADPRLPASLRRLVCDPQTGHLLDRGRASYAITDELRDYLSVRDRTCRFPGCPRPARLCQVDHATSWKDGGTTDRANTGLLCVRHHQLKTHAGWRIVRSEIDGTVIWQSPLGRTYRVHPPPQAPD